MTYDLRAFRNHKPQSLFDIREISEDVREWIYQQEDDNLSVLKNCFIETDAYIQLWKENKFLLSWRKWTWKSAIRRMFCYQAKEKWMYAKDIRFKELITEWVLQKFHDVNWYEYSKDLESEILFVIFAELLKILKELNPEDSKITKLTNIFAEYVDPAGLLFAILDTGEFKNILKRFEELKISFYGVEMNTKNKTKEEIIHTDLRIESRDDIKRYLVSLKAFIFDIVASSNKDIIIFLDEVDSKIAQNWELYRKMLLGYINSIIEINKDYLEFKEKGNSNRSFKIILAIRDDFLRDLNIEDSNFVKNDKYIVSLNWTKNYLNENSDLNNMLEKRITEWMRQSDIIDDWFLKPFYKSFLLGDKIFKEINRIDKEKFLKNFFYNKTFLRPRDILIFFEIISKHQNLSDFNDEFSSKLWQQFQNEISHLIPASVDKKEEFRKIEDVLSVLMRKSRESGWEYWVFSKQEFLNALSSSNKSEYLQFCYESWVIGAFDPQNSYIEFKYRGDKAPNFWVVDYFMLHRGFFRFFNLW